MKGKRHHPRCRRGHVLALFPDGAYYCYSCSRRRPAAVVVPLDADLIADLRATPGVAFAPDGSVRVTQVRFSSERKHAP